MIEKRLNQHIAKNTSNSSSDLSDNSTDKPLTTDIGITTFIEIVSSSMLPNWLILCDMFCPCCTHSPLQHMREDYSSSLQDMPINVSDSLVCITLKLSMVMTSVFHAI